MIKFYRKELGVSDNAFVLIRKVETFHNILRPYTYACFACRYLQAYEHAQRFEKFEKYLKWKTVEVEGVGRGLQKGNGANYLESKEIQRHDEL